jgi:hypothetical protein
MQYSFSEPVTMHVKTGTNKSGTQNVEGSELKASTSKYKV